MTEDEISVIIPATGFALRLNSTATMISGDSEARGAIHWMRMKFRLSGVAGGTEPEVGEIEDDQACRHQDVDLPHEEDEQRSDRSDCKYPYFKAHLAAHVERAPSPQPEDEE